MSRQVGPLGSGRAALMAMTALACLSIGYGAAAQPAADLSRRPIAENPAWKKLVLNVPGEFASGRAVSVEGNAAAVRNPDGLLSVGGGATTLTSQTPGDVRIIIDIGVVVSGFVEVGVKSSSGAPLRLAYSEAREYLRKNGDASVDQREFFYNGRTLGLDDDPDGRADVFETSRSGKFTSPGLRGAQRYIAISLDRPGTVTIDYVRVRQTNFHGRYDGRFLSSDERLNRAWYASAYGVDLSTIRDLRRDPAAPWVIVDGPKRDRVAYAQDLWFAGRSAYAQSADYRRVVRDTLNLWACQQYPDGSLPAVALAYVPCKIGEPGPPDGPPKGFEPPGEAAFARLDGFDIWWVIGLAEYMRQSGDRAFVEPLLPVARGILGFTAAHAPDGLLFRTGTYNGRLGFSWHTPDKSIGVDAGINAAYVQALRDLARLERTLAEDPAAAAVLEDRAAQVQAALIEKMWDPKAGAFILNSEDPKADHTADANAIALLLGTVDDDKARQVRAFIDARLATPFGTANSEYPDNPYMSQYHSPYIMGLETLGRFRYGDGQGALDLMRKAWTHMLEKGPGTPWEEIGIDGRPNVARGTGSTLSEGSQVGMAHAWSTVVPALSEYVLGVRPLEDNYASWEAAPQPVDLGWAEGQVPARDGVIAVRWRREPGDAAFVLTVAPSIQTAGRIAVPLLGAERTIYMDGRIVWEGKGPAAGVQASRQGDAVVFRDLKGAHTFAWTAR